MEMVDSSHNCCLPGRFMLDLPKLWEKTSQGSIEEGDGAVTVEKGRIQIHQLTSDSGHGGLSGETYVMRLSHFAARHYGMDSLPYGYNDKNGSIIVIRKCRSRAVAQRQWQLLSLQLSLWRQFADQLTSSDALGDADANALPLFLRPPFPLPLAICEPLNAVCVEYVRGRDISSEQWKEVRLNPGLHRQLGRVCAFTCCAITQRGGKCATTKSLADCFKWMVDRIDDLSR